jgi:hypothetical protein
MSHLIDLQGQKFGAWTVIAGPSRNTNNQTTWHCQCECGATREVVAQTLRLGRTKSCGCLKGEAIAKANRTTGKGHIIKNATPEFRAWRGMLNRCSPDNRWMKVSYHDRGIRVCERWIDSFENFLEDMGPIPQKGFSLDRIDNNGNYEPENCRWTDAKTQALNRRPVKEWEPPEQKSARIANLIKKNILQELEWLSESNTRKRVSRDVILMAKGEIERLRTLLLKIRDTAFSPQYDDEIWMDGLTNLGLFIDMNLEPS